MEKLIESIEEKFETLDKLVVYIGYNLELDNEVILSDKMTEKVWYYIDMYPGWLSSRIEGRCSLSAMINFSLEQEEKKIEREIKFFQKWLRLSGYWKAFQAAV